MNRWTKWCGVGAAVVGGAAMSAGANLVNNPSFADGNAWWTINSGGGTAQILNNFGRTDSNCFFVAAEANANVELVSQSQFTTAPLEQLQVDFWIYNNGVGDDGITLRLGNANAWSESPLSASLESWTFYSMTLAAPGGTTWVQFDCFDAISSFMIDDISVTRVPAPAAVALAPVAGLVAMRRRR